MKFKYKIVSVIGIILIGVIGLNYYSYKDYMNKQKERIELFFKYNYNDIDSITFTEIKKNPMGSLDFYGYFNSDKSNTFIGSVMPYQKEFERNNVMVGDFSRENAKFENGKTYTVSEIEKIKREERQTNSQESNSTWFSESSESSQVNNYLTKF